LRWFLLSSEALEISRGRVPSVAKVPFTPRQYFPIKSAGFQLRHYSTISSINESKNAREPMNDVIKPEHVDEKHVSNYLSESSDSKNFTATISLNFNVTSSLKSF
jgi:hypothetical protein